jgi:hypothetical protein
VDEQETTEKTESGIGTKTGNFSVAFVSSCSEMGFRCGQRPRWVIRAIGGCCIRLNSYQFSKNQSKNLKRTIRVATTTAWRLAKLPRPPFELLRFKVCL